MNEYLERIERTSRIIKKFPRQKIMVNYIDELWSIDLADFSNKKYEFKYVLFVIDGWSKYLWISFLKNKTADEILNGILDIFKQTTRRPEKIMSDQEAGLFSKKAKDFFQKNNIFLYHTNTGSDEQAASHNPFAERVIGTIKLWVSRYYFNLEMKNALVTAVEKYNNTIHSTIKMTPIDASKNSNQKKLAKTFTNYYSDYEPKDYNILNQGDNVRIYQFKKKFEKGYEPRWSKEIFTIGAVHPTKPVTYTLFDQKGEKIIGKFYSQQLLKSSVAQ